MAHFFVQRVTIENGWEKSEGFSGCEKLLVPVTRKSNKRYEEACSLVTEELISELKFHCKINYLDVI